MSCNPAGSAGLEFFGKISASISHEIKNVMATINESAGLLEDLTLMAEKGRPTDPQKLKMLAGRITNQIRRGDAIVRNLNRLAHSVEDAQKEVDLSEMLEFMKAITERIAAARSITLEVRKSGSPINVRTQPFFLQTLLYLCLDFAMTVAGSEKKIVLIAEPAKIRFTGLETLSESAFFSFSEQAAKALPESLSIEFIMDSQIKEIILLWTDNE